MICIYYITYHQQFQTGISIPCIFRYGRTRKNYACSTLGAAVVSALCFFRFFFLSDDKQARVRRVLTNQEAGFLRSTQKLLVTPDQFIGRRPPRWWRNRARRCWSWSMRREASTCYRRVYTLTKETVMPRKRRLRLIHRARHPRSRQPSPSTISTMIPWSSLTWIR